MLFIINWFDFILSGLLLIMVFDVCFLFTESDYDEDIAPIPFHAYFLA